MFRFLAALVVVVPIAAQASDLEKEAKDMMVSVEMGQIISSAEICGYVLSTDKLAKFMQTRIAGLSEGARFNYYAITTTYPDELKQMPATAKSAKCELQRTIAKKEGLLDVDE